MHEGDGGEAPRRPLLVGRVPVRVQQAHGNRVRVYVRKACEVKRLELPFRAHPPGNSVTALERHERLPPGRARPIEMRARLTAQMEEMLEPSCRDERGSRALPFEQRVGRNRRPVREALDPGGSRGPRRGDNRFLLALGGQHLRSPDATAVEHDSVGERAADVDAEDNHSGRPFHPLGVACRRVAGTV